jgi:hypothetical protein
MAEPLAPASVLRCREPLNRDPEVRESLQAPLEEEQYHKKPVAKELVLFRQ